MKYFTIFSLLFFIAQSFAASIYFQQEVHYKIDVTLNVKGKNYQGHETLTYVNHSPDTLSYVWLHLYPNAYRSTNTPFARQQEARRNSRFYFSDPEERGYLDLTKIETNGKTLTHSLKDNAPDEAKITLPEPLLPGDTLVLNLDFKGKFPKVFSRMGTWGRYYFAATQWYPKMVVYDQQGWHPDSYLDQGEFYGEYGSFDVRITLPKSFVVEATGMLKDDPQEEVFMQTIADTTEYFLGLDKHERKKFVKKWIKDREKELDLNETKTVHFYAEKVHNFAWFAGLHYLVLKKIQPNGVLTHVLVEPASAYQWRHVPEYVTRTLEFYGRHVGPYQYPKASVVQGDLRAGGGMEYPMVTIISIPALNWTRILEMVVMHEVGHNWFMGMLGSDERASAFLDEGMNSFLELKYMEHYYGKYNLTNFKKLLHGLDLLRDIGEWQTMQMSYGSLVAQRTDLPLNLRAEEYNTSNYNSVSYHKGALLLLALEEYLSPEVFWRGMRTYFERWNGKHPTVQDFFQTMEDVSGEDLDWFVEEWYNSTTYCDFVIADLKQNEKTQHVEVFVKNKGAMKRMPAPVRLVTVAGDTLEHWWNGNPQEPVIFKVKAPVKMAEVNPRHTIFEMSYVNNRSGLLPPIKFNWFPQIPDFEHYEINIFPYYWYESFVDKHRLGGMFWGGNPIFKQWFWAGHVYYGTCSGELGYELSLTNRFYLPLANYTEVKGEVFDQDGMRKQSLVFDNYFKKRGTDYPLRHLILSLENVDLYEPDYYESTMFQKARYGVASLKYSYKNRWMLQSVSGHVRLEKGLELQDRQVDFTKLEISGYFWRRPFKNTWFRLDGYLANIWGTKVPLQENIFAAGDVDPRHQQFAFGRRGRLAPNRYFTFTSGMKMYGYNDTQNPFFYGKSGAALSLSVKPYKYVPVIYTSAALLSPKSLDFKTDRMFAEAGIKTNIAGGDLIFPLYVSDPAPGEKHLDFRFLFNFNFNISFGF